MQDQFAPLYGLLRTKTWALAKNNAGRWGLVEKKRKKSKNRDLREVAAGCCKFYRGVYHHLDNSAQRGRRKSKSRSIQSVFSTWITRDFYSPPALELRSCSLVFTTTGISRPLPPPLGILLLLEVLLVRPILVLPLLVAPVAAASQYEPSLLSLPLSLSRSRDISVLFTLASRIAFVSHWLSFFHQRSGGFTVLESGAYSCATPCDWYPFSGRLTSPWACLPAARCPAPITTRTLAAGAPT